MSKAEAEAYVKTLEVAGWKIVSRNDEYVYSCQLQKDKTWARVFFDKPLVLEVGFSDVAELLDR